jgi:DNA polymerase-3 subunit gamma/tau
MNWTEKYRPVTFDDFWQSESPALKFLRNAVRLDAVPEALIVVGAYGTGKTSLARVIGRRLNCWRCSEHPYNPCGQCDGCEEVLPFSHNTIIGDGYMEWDVTGATSDHILSVIREYLRYNKMNGSLANISPNWVVCLDEIARVKSDIQEKMIKVLENIRRTHFILCFSDPTTIIDPIRERGVLAKLPLPTTEECVSALIKIAHTEGYELDEFVARVGTESVRNVPRRCIMALQQAAILSPSKSIGIDAMTDAVEMVAQ